jgi:hypothetical protein
MWFRSLFDALKNRPSRQWARSTRLIPSRRFELEALEDRTVPSFSPAVSYPVGVSPSAMVSGDFDGDGRPDLATANAGSNNVSLLLGNGDGSFQAARQFASGVEPISVAVGDFNGDGRLDLVTSDHPDHVISIRLLLGNGDGTFQAAREIAGIAGPLSVGDFNGDARLDIVTPGKLLLGNGDGTFQAAQNVPGGGSSMAVGDFNGDGSLDLAGSYWVGDNEGGGYLIDVVLGNGDGTFSSPYTVGAGDSPVVGDVNEDGRLDLVAADEFGDEEVLLGNGNGTFQSNSSWMAPETIGARMCALGDINGDGHLDIVTAAGDSIHVLLGDGVGNFPTLQTFTVGSSPTSLVVQNLNADGYADVVVGRSGANVVSVLINDGVWPPPPLPSVGFSYENVIVVTEGNTGTTAAVFTISLSHAYIEPVTVNYATDDTWGEATAGSDYQAASGTLTFAPGETSKTITVLVNGDRIIEPTENFAVFLSDATKAIIGGGAGFGTILDDEPRIDISGIGKYEGRKGRTTLFTFTVTLSNAYDQPVTMSYRTADGTAKTSDNDYVAKTGTLTFAPGETTKTITIEVKGDSKKEADETFYLDLFGLSSNALFTKNHGLGTILNDD